MNSRTLSAVLAAASLCAPLAALALDFDRGIDIAPLLDSARRETKTMPSLQAASFTGNMWTTTDSKEVTLAPGQQESAYVEMVSAAYREVCETPSPYVGPICRTETITREPRRFKLVLAEPIPAAWGPQTFRLRLDVLRRPTLGIEARDSSHAWEFRVPEFYEDVLIVRPLPAGKAAVSMAGLTICTLRDIVKDQCVYRCRDGREILRPVTPANPDGTPAIACPQVIIPF